MCQLNSNPHHLRETKDLMSLGNHASERSVSSTSGTLVAGVGPILLQLSVEAKSMPSPPTITPRPSLTKSPTSPQSASLGRATQPPPASTVMGIITRWNSLGDLKIPARISKAQVGSKRDSGMDREFAAEVESEHRSCSTLMIAGAEPVFRAQRASNCLQVRLVTRFPRKERSTEAGAGARQRAALSRYCTLRHSTTSHISHIYNISIIRHRKGGATKVTKILTSREMPP